MRERERERVRASKRAREINGKEKRNTTKQPQRVQLEWKGGRGSATRKVFSRCCAHTYITYFTACREGGGWEGQCTGHGVLWPPPGVQCGRWRADDVVPRPSAILGNPCRLSRGCVTRRQSPGRRVYVIGRRRGGHPVGRTTAWRHIGGVPLLSARHTSTVSDDNKNTVHTWLPRRRNGAFILLL